MLLLSLAACASDDTSPDGSTTPSDSPVAGLTQEQIDEAMNTPTTLDYWTWVADIQNEVDLFTAKYPNIKVNVVNNGDSAAQITKLRAAIQAGTDVPDAVQIGYDYLPGFIQNNSLLDLTPFGAAELESLFVPGIWSQVTLNDGIYAIPQDSGAMGMLYRTDIFKKAGVEVPATWADYATAAQTIKDKTGSYITTLPGNDWPMIIGFLSQGGATPFEYGGGEDITINLDSPEAQKVISYWQDLIKKDLVAVDPDFTDDWYQGLAKSKYASWVVPGWGPLFLSGTAADTAGKWKAVEMPQWEAGRHVSANWGGSTNAVPAASDSQIAAYMLTKFINTDPESTLKLANEQSLFPTTVDTLANPEFTNYESEFFGGQKVNEVFAQITTTVAPNLHWTPLADYINESQNKTLGKAITEKGDMLAGLTAWQDDLVAYAKEQGFAVK
jgi:multiple sugar transport system substrate-binding protein